MQRLQSGRSGMKRRVVVLKLFRFVRGQVDLPFGAILTGAAKVPWEGCAPSGNVCGAVEFFLSPAVAFITGQLLP